MICYFSYVIWDLFPLSGHSFFLLNKIELPAFIFYHQISCRFDFTLHNFFISFTFQQYHNYLEQESYVDCFCLFHQVVSSKYVKAKHVVFMKVHNYGKYKKYGKMACSLIKVQEHSKYIKSMRVRRLKHKGVK